MKILFLTPGTNAPSSRFRVAQFVPHLRARGHRCVVAPSRPNQYEHYPLIGWRLSQRLRRALREVDLTLARLRDFDVIFLERELFNDPTFDSEERFRRAGSAMVLDLDDAIWLNHPGKLERIAAFCDGAIAGNSFLAGWLGRFNPHVTVIPTCVDLDRYVPRPPGAANPVPVIGWTGSSSTMPYLAAIAEPLRALASSRRFELRIIADSAAPLAKLDLRGVDVKFVPWRAATEIEDLRPFDIGLMPLPDDEWSCGKCGFKIIQYLGLGIPAVASPIGVNREIISDGANGFLATSSDEWQNALAVLLEDAALRRQLGQAGRQTIAERYSIAANLPRLEQTLAAAVTRARGSAGTP